MLGYRVPAPDEAMLISGGQGRTEGSPFRVVVGHGTFVMPFFRKVRFLSLALYEAEVSDTCVTRQGISLTVRAVIAFKVRNDTEGIVNAAQRFLSDQREMTVLTGRIFAGHLRSIVGSVTVEQIVRERQVLATEILDGCKPEMAKIGLTVDSVQIQSIDDLGSGYIDAMAAPHNAAIQREAKIAQAEADRAAVEAQQASARQQAEYSRQTSIVQAEYSAEVERARATSAQAGPLSAAQAQREVVRAQTELAEREAELRAQQLEAEVVRPATAEAERIRILAEAQARRIRIEAEAVAANDRVALDRMLIDQLPSVVAEVSRSLANANVTVLNGSDGLGEVAAGLVGQGLTIYDALRAGLGSGAERPSPTEPTEPAALTSNGIRPPSPEPRAGS